MRREVGVGERKEERGGKELSTIMRVLIIRKKE
jgi:hypothetical protein